MWLHELVTASGVIPEEFGNSRENTFSIDGKLYSPECIKQIGHIHVQFDGLGNHISLAGTTWLDGALAFVFHGDRNTVTLGRDGYVGADTTFLFYRAGVGVECTDCEVFIGDRFKLNGNAIHLELGEPQTSIRIGKDFLCAAGVRMATSDNHPIFDLASRSRINLPGNIYIGDRVWLCRDVMVMNHTSIPSHTIVAARSVVTKHFVEHHTLLAGAPALVRRRNVSWAFELDAECPSDGISEESD